MYEWSLQQVKTLDSKPPVSVGELISYRHLHSHDISQCPTCKSERMHWFSIVSIPLMMVANLEDIRKSKEDWEKASIIPTPELNIYSVQGNITLKAVGYLTYTPGHWTSSVISPDGESVYYFNDPDGFVTKQPYTSTKLSALSTSAIVYVRDYPEQWKQKTDKSLLMGSSLTDGCKG